MKKIIPFKKDILFKTNLAEIISISLDHKIEEVANLIKGEFTVSGEYKMLDTSVNTEKFSYGFPFTIDLDDRYIIDNIDIDIDDFYYEIINDNTMSVHIDVAVDNLEEKKVLEEKIIVREELPLDEEQVPEIEEVEDIKENCNMEENKHRCIEEENIFEYKEDKENYKSYTIYIVREGDTIESIINNYQINKEVLELYNDLSEVKIGDKIIIPSND